jgi:hypothetical protein
LFLLLTSLFAGLFSSPFYQAERDEAVALIDSDGGRARGSDIPAIGDEVLLRQLQIAEERLHVSTDCTFVLFPKQ